MIEDGVRRTEKTGFRKSARISLICMAVLSLPALVAGIVPGGAPPLIQACAAGHLAKVQQLVAQVANVNAQNGLGETALMLAAEHKEVCEMLVAHGADLNARDEKGTTALGHALHEHHNDVADFLRSKGAKE